MKIDKEKGSVSFETDLVLTLVVIAVMFYFAIQWASPSPAISYFLSSLTKFWNWISS